MIPSRLYLYSLLSSVLPETRFFRLKASLLRWCGAKIGSNVRICSSARIYGVGDLKIGDDVWIGSDVFIQASADIHIGSYVDIAPLVYIGTGTHAIDESGPHSAGDGKNLPITVSDGVWLCVGAYLLPGVTVGTNSVVAAGTVVNNTVPARCVVAGVPMKIKRHFLIGKANKGSNE